MNSKVTLHFYAKSTKANGNGLLPIYVRLTIEGKRFEYSTKKFITKLGLEKSSAKFVPRNSIVIALAGQGKTSLAEACLVFAADH